MHETEAGTGAETLFDFIQLDPRFLGPGETDP